MTSHSVGGQQANSKRLSDGLSRFDQAPSMDSTDEKNWDLGQEQLAALSFRKDRVATFAELDLSQCSYVQT